MSPHAASKWVTVRAWLAWAGLVGLVAAVYWPVAGYEFVNWDDPWYVLKNPLITSWHPTNLWRIATEQSVKNYAPLTTLSLLVDHTLFGLNAGGYHVVNVILHAANVLLVCLLVTRLTGHRMVGLMTAALFAVHPVQIETVAWVSSRKTLLCSLFMLASGLCWLRPERTGKQERWGTVFLALALLAKAAAVVVPTIVIAYDLLIARKSFRDSLVRQIVPMFLCVLLLGITMSAQSQYMGGVRSHMSLSKWHILGVDSIILWKYVGMLIAPTNLSLLYDPPTTGIATAVVWSVCGWMLVGLLGWHWRTARPGFAFAVVCWFCLLAPVLNLFPITTLMNDRYLYLPCVGFFALASTGAMQLMAWSGCFAADPDRAERRSLAFLNGTATLMVSAVVCGYALISIDRLPIWKTDEALWRQTVGQVPQLAVVQIQWADSLYANGHEEAAVASLRLALSRCHPDKADRDRMRERLVKWQKPSSNPPTSFVSLEAEEQPPRKQDREPAL